MSSGGGETASEGAFGAGGRVKAATHGGVTRAEFFLDLVFVFAFFNVTHLMSERSATDALLFGGLVVLLLWRSWAGYAWVGNLVRLDRNGLPVAVFAMATAILLVAVAIPEVFVEHSAGLSGPLVFVVGFLTARVGSLLIISAARRGTERSSAAARRAWLPLAGSLPLLLSAVLLPAHLPSGRGAEVLQLVLVVVAIVVDYLGLRAPGIGTWQLTSVRHWAERHNLIMLIALGETIISIGTSRGLLGDDPITWSVLAGAVLALVVVAFLWWAYFDIAAPAGEAALESTPRRERSRRARDAYTLLHLPMIAGLILVAFGLKRALGGTPSGHPENWTMADLAVLYGGVVLYLVGLVAFEWRTVRRIGRGPVFGLVLVAVLAAPARYLTALGSLTILAVALFCVVVAHLTALRHRHRELHRAVAATVGREVDATPEELFLDLVFVYAFLQVTVIMTRHPSVTGVTLGLAVLALLWWSWVNYTWFTTTIRGPENSLRLRLVVLAAVALILTLGIAAPQTFSDVSGGLPAPLIVVTSYAAVRLLHLASFWWVLRHDIALRSIVVRAAVPTGVGIALLLSAVSIALATGDPLTPLTALCWAAAIVIDVGGGYLIGSRNWRLRSVSRWMGRFNLILLIALGQAVISTGIAASDPPISPSTFVTVALSATLLSAMWWTYVGTDIVVGQRFTELTQSRQRGALARDAYAYLHLFLVVGLVLVAFGLRTTLPQQGRNSASLAMFGQVTLTCGIVVYLLADHLVWQRARRRIAGRRAANLVVAALAPATIFLPIQWALAALALALFAAHLLARTSTPPLDTVLDHRM
ncbi:low temperature requirement protein A [Plantactinospora sp. KLBMP9567]|uniref:low temperature requirement protein A n=1 Tax=Plantactinospora sp. KLBMP9567 TaxID=3085900 RepID=UPI0029820ABF|nr:low temperature requirement protein A [Plantactinospora sp. KLBMP9567]MDW5325037.1 low temperature requirement protein A [Plantactinospora sp. KLBMP9567]